MMNAWDGIFGLIGKVSFINHFVTLIIKYWYLKTKKFFAWPNIKAKRLIVPERIGKISPKQIAKEVVLLINNEENLKTLKGNLLKQRGSQGAVERLANIILDAAKNFK